MCHFSTTLRPKCVLHHFVSTPWKKSFWFPAQSVKLRLYYSPELFIKDALMWFRSRNFTSWDDLTDQLKNAFQPYEYEFDLMKEIRRRTQGPKERVVTYLAERKCLFKTLGSSRSKELSKIALIRRNMLPHIKFQLALQNVESMKELTYLCIVVEETALRSQKYQPPPTDYRSQN